MCRLLGVIATTAAPIADLVSDELRRLEGLSALHADGWGIAHLAGAPHGEVCVAKAPGSASTSEAWRAAVRDTVTDAALLHIRQASPGMPLTLANTHPFLADGMAFAHNGHAHPRATLDTLVADAQALPPGGDTDSERYFALVRAGSEAGLEPAILGAAERIAAAATATSLNALVLSPRTLAAIAWWHAPVIRTAGDEETERDYRLWYRMGHDRVVVASADVADDDPCWRELPHGCVLSVDRGTLQARIVPGSEDVAAA